jgi:formyltetrahydrofolate synthetase
VRGLEHLDHHVKSVRRFGFEPVIAINVFGDDREAGLLRGQVEIIFTFGRTWTITAVLRFLARERPLPAKRALH